MHIWMGECHVHAGINGAELKARVAEEPDAELFVHPECGCATSALYLVSSGAVPETRTKILSTGGMIDAARDTTAVDGAGRHRDRHAAPAAQANPAVDFQPVNRAAVCKYMKMITPAKLLRSLREGVDEIHIDRDIADRARAVGRADDRHRHPIADGRMSRRRFDEPPDCSSRPRAATWHARRRRRRARLRGGRPVGGARGPAGAQRARGDQGRALSAGSTQWAQGGLAGVLDPSDTLENHVRDTLDAGAGLCDEAVVRELVTEAPKSIRYLMRLGAAFDPRAGLAATAARPIALTREGGHSHNRIVHAGGDQSGAEVQRTLDESALGAGVEVLEPRVRARPRPRHRCRR